MIIITSSSRSSKAHILSPFRQPPFIPPLQESPSSPLLAVTPSNRRRKSPDGLALVRVSSVTPDAVQMQVNSGVQDAVQVTYSAL